MSERSSFKREALSWIGCLLSSAGPFVARVAIEGKHARDELAAINQRTGTVFRHLIQLPKEFSEAGTPCIRDRQSPHNPTSVVLGKF